MKKILLINLISILAIISCVKDPGMEKIEKFDYFEREMFISVEGTDSDAVAVYDENKAAKFVNVPYVGKTAYAGVIKDAEQYYVVSPYFEGSSLVAGRVAVSYPSSVTLSPSIEPSELKIAAGIVSQGAVSLKNLTSLAVFSITGDGISSITLRGKDGEKVAGDVYVDFNNAPEVSLESLAGHSSYSLGIRPSGTGFEEGNYSLPILPVQMNNGVELEFTRTTDDKIAFVSIPASGCDTLNFGNIAYSDLSWKKVIPLRFVESALASETLWPFEEPASAGVKPEFTTIKGGYKIIADNFKGLIADGCKGFVYGSAAGDGIMLPAIEGYALNEVGIILGADGDAGNPCIKNASGKVVGETWTGVKNAGDTKTWTFFGEHNMVNTICLSSDPGEDGCSIRSIILSYRVAADKEYIVYDVTTRPATDIVAKNGQAILHASYSASLDEPSKYEAGFEYRIKGEDNWTRVSVTNPAQSDFSYTLSGIETEHTYEFRAYVKGETDIDTTYGKIEEFEISNSLTLELEFGDGTTSKTLYNQWNALWGLTTGNSGVKGPVDKVYSKDGVDYTFTLCADHNVAYRSASSKYWGYCFDYSTVTTEDHYNGWMRLPGVEGMRLSYVEIKINQKCQINLSSSVDSNNFGNKTYTDGSNIAQTATTATNTIEVEGTKAGERVYLCVEGRNATAMYLILKYIPVK